MLKDFSPPRSCTSVAKTETQETRWPWPATTVGYCIRIKCVPTLVSCLDDGWHLHLHHWVVFHSLPFLSFARFFHSLLFPPPSSFSITFLHHSFFFSSFIFIKLYFHVSFLSPFYFIFVCTFLFSWNSLIPSLLYNFVYYIFIFIIWHTSNDCGILKLINYKSHLE